MKRARFRDEQIVRILRETDKDTAVEVVKRHGVVSPQPTHLDLDLDIPFRIA